MSADPKASKASPSLTSKEPAASSSSASATSSSSASSSSSSSSSSSAAPADTAVAIHSDGFTPIAAPIVNPHISFRNWLIVTAVITAFIVLLLVANASESIPEAPVWLILFASIWGFITLCCGMFKTAERCATYVREQEMHGYLGTNGEVETSTSTAAATDSGAGDAKYQKL